MVKRPAKVNNICPSLIHRSYINDCPANTVESSDHHARDFAYIRRQSPAFVDKTDFIKDIIDSDRRMILTAPHHFGKSVNLSMLKYFFEIEADKETAEPITRADIRKEPVTDTCNYELFENLAVHRLHPEIMKNWFGRHPVIHLDFSLKSSINSYQEAYDHCINVIRETFKQHSYLLNSKKFRESSTIRMYCNDIEFQKMKHSIQNGSWSWTGDVRHLIKVLFEHFGRQCIVLVDEYDAVFRASLGSINRDTFEKCRNLCENMIDHVTRRDHNLELIAHAVLSGISYMAVYGTRNLWCVNAYKFLQCGSSWWQRIYNFHGFTQKEFDFLMNKHNIPSDIRQQVTEYYNGYCSVDDLYGDKKFYNPYSVTRFLQTKIIQSYWSSAEFFEKYQFMFDYSSSDLIIKQLIFGQTLDAYLDFKCDSRYLFDELYNKKSTGYLMPYLYERGYLQPVCYDRSSLGKAVKVANEEIKISLINDLKKYYRTCGKFDWDSMESCAERFDNINFASDQDLRKIYSLLGKYCDEFFSKNEESIAGTYYNDNESFIIEEYLRRLLYNIASLTKHKITIIDPQEYRNFERARAEKPINKITPDIKMCSDHGCIMIQAKYNITSEAALNQLILHSCRDETIKHVLIGLNLSKNKRLSMSAKIGGNFFTYSSEDGLTIENSTK